MRKVFQHPHSIQWWPLRASAARMRCNRFWNLQMFSWTGMPLVVRSSTESSGYTTRWSAPSPTSWPAAPCCSGQALLSTCMAPLQATCAAEPFSHWVGWPTSSAALQSSCLWSSSACQTTSLQTYLTWIRSSRSVEISSRTQWSRQQSTLSGSSSHASSQNNSFPSWSP